MNASLSSGSTRIRYPAALRRGGTIAVTAPSSGLGDAWAVPRFNRVMEHLRGRGYRVRVGKCLVENTKHVSAPSAERAAEFSSYWLDPSVDALIPPWGGELLIDLLHRLDFDAFARSRAPWILGYSDISTLLFAMTSRARIATMHGTNLMDLIPCQVFGVTQAALSSLELESGREFSQESYSHYQLKSGRYQDDVNLVFNVTEPVLWRGLRGEPKIELGGRLIGGCLDTLVNLVGTPYGDLPRFNRDFRDDGVVLYFENAELSPCGLARALWNLRLAGWFDGVSGVVFGRHSAQDATDPRALSMNEAIESVLGELGIPVILGADIGHRPPQMILVNGAKAVVRMSEGRGRVDQTLA